MRSSLAVRIARIVLLILALAIIVVTAIPAGSGDTWWVRYLDFPRLEFMIAGILIWVLLVLLPRSWPSLLVLAVLLSAIAYDGSVLYFYTPLPAPQEIAAGSCPAGNRLRLLEVNVQMTNRHTDKLLNIVRRISPDVAWFQETNDWWAKELSPLSDTMPNRVVQTDPNYFGVILYSRLPLVGPQVKHLTGSANPSVFTGVRLPSGQVIKLYAIHPRPPQEGQSTAERNAQLLATALAAHDDKAPHVVAGDMNSVPWETVIHQTERVGRFLDPRIGRGLYITWSYITWSTENPVTKWPLDQILPGPNFTLLSLKVLPAFGSDHHPYLAELCLNPSAASRQPPPSLESGDLASARAEVAKGQEKADKQGYKGRYTPDND